MPACSSNSRHSHAVAIPWLEKAGVVPALDKVGIVGLGTEDPDASGRVPERQQRIPKPVVRLARNKLLPRWIKRAVRQEPKKKRPGSGLPARRSIRILVQLRRMSQATFLLLFCYLLVETGFRGNFGDGEVRLPYPVEGFLSADPFVALMTLLSTHTLYHGLIWSLGVVILTLVVGRAFCGWICRRQCAYRLRLPI